MNTNTPFIQAFSYLIALFKSVISSLDSIILFGHTSLLELIIVLGLMGIIVSVLIPVISGSVSSSPSTSASIANSFRRHFGDKVTKTSDTSTVSARYNK